MGEIPFDPKDLFEESLKHIHSIYAEFPHLYSNASLSFLCLPLLWLCPSSLANSFKRLVCFWCVVRWTVLEIRDVQTMVLRYPIYE